MFDNETTSHLFYLFVLNYNKEGEYKDIENVRVGLTHEEQMEMFGEKVMYLSEHFGTLPFLIDRMEYDTYGIPTYNITTIDETYALGNQKQVDEAIKIYIDDRWITFLLF